MGLRLVADLMAVGKQFQSQPGVSAIAVIAVGYRYAPRHLAVVLGVAGGLAYGLTAALIKDVTGTASHAPLTLLSTWPFYALIVIGGAAFVLNQAAYQAGPLAASLPPLTMLNPVVAISAGVLVFDEHLTHTAVAVSVASAAFLAVSLATVQLARRSALPRHRG